MDQVDGIKPIQFDLATTELIRDTPDLILPNGHKDFISGMCLSKDEKYMATGSFERRIMIWDTQTGLITKILKENGSINGLEFSPKGKYLLSFVLGQKLKIWDVEKGVILKEFGGMDLNAGIFINRGNQVLTCSKKNPIQIWDLKSGELLHSFEASTKKATLPILNAKGDKLITSTEEKNLVLIDIKNKKILQEFKGHTNIVGSYQFSSDEKELITGSWDKTARIWDIKTGKVKQTFNGHTHYVNSVALNQDKTQLLTVSTDNTAILWDANKGTEIHKFGPLGTWTSPNSGFFTFDDQKILLSVSGGGLGQSSGFLQLWDLASLKLEKDYNQSPNGSHGVLLTKEGRSAFSTQLNIIKQWDLESGRLINTYKRSTMDSEVFGFSSDGKKMMINCVGEEKRQLDLTTSKQNTIYTKAEIIKNAAIFKSKVDQGSISTTTDKTLYFHETSDPETVTNMKVLQGRISHSDIDVENNLIATGLEKGALKIWDKKTKLLKKTLEGHTKYITNVVFSPSGKFLITTGWDKRAILWNPKTGDKIFEIEGEEYSTQQPVFTADEKYVVIDQAGNNIVVVEVETGKKILNYKGKLFTPFFKGTSIAILNGSKIDIHDIHNPDSLFSIPISSTSTYGFAVNPAGESLVFIDQNHIVYHYNLLSRDLVMSTKDSDERSNKIMFHPSGDFFTTSNRDGSINFWNSQNGEKILTYVFLENNGWLVLDSKGKFDGTKTAFSKLYYHDGSRNITLEELVEERYEKDLIKRVLKL